MINILLNFLGINSWYINFYPVKKKSINYSFKSEVKSLKTINNVLSHFTPSPKLERYKIEFLEIPTLSEKIFYSLYSFYSLCILGLVSVQPIYALIMYIQNTQDRKFLVSSLLHFNIPFIYLWAKFYFKTDHFDKLNVCVKFKTSIITLSTIISIVINFIDISSFNNKYYWLDNFNDITFNIIVIIEWLYSRLIIFTLIFTFIFILNVHIKRFGDIIYKLDNNEFNFDDNTCLSNIIKELSKIRHEIEYTIHYFNMIISFTTILGGISLSIFIRDLFPNGINDFRTINFEIHDRYLIHPLGLYLVSNIILILNMTRYSYKREAILKYIKSMNFMNCFLTRTSSEKIMKRSDGNINMVVLNIAEESATTLDWIILGQILSEKWLDFTIFGVSTSDGNLIKRSLALGSTLLFLINILQNNN